MVYKRRVKIHVRVASRVQGRVHSAKVHGLLTFRHRAIGDEPGAALASSVFRTARRRMQVAAIALGMKRTA